MFGWLQYGGVSFDGSADAVVEISVKTWWGKEDPFAKIASLDRRDLESWWKAASVGRMYVGVAYNEPWFGCGEYLVMAGKKGHFRCLA